MDSNNHPGPEIDEIRELANISKRIDQLKPRLLYLTTLSGELDELRTALLALVADTLMLAEIVRFDRARRMVHGYQRHVTNDRDPNDVPLNFYRRRP